MRRRGILAAALAGLWLAALGPARADDPLQARAFEVRFRPLADAQALVTPVLSPDGSVTMQPRLKTLVVQDHPAVLERVAGLLQGFDLPPRSVEVTLSLFLGTDRREQEAGRNVPSESLSRDVRGVAETLADFTNWNAYQLLGGKSVAATEGSAVHLQISDEYRVAFDVDAILDRPGAQVLQFKNFTLERVTRDTDGRERSQELYTTHIVVPAGKMLMVGIAQNPDSKRALFLSVLAKPR